MPSAVVFVETWVRCWSVVLVSQRYLSNLSIKKKFFYTKEKEHKNSNALKVRHGKGKGKKMLRGGIKGLSCPSEREFQEGS